MKYKIGLIGFGTVGQGIAGILLNKKDYLRKRYGFEFEITAIAGSRYGTAYNPSGLHIKALLNDAQNGKRFSQDLVDWDNLKLIKDTDTNVWCELTYTDLKTGGLAVNHVKSALCEGKHVVTSNKGPAALFYSELQSLAAEHNVKFLVEGTVLAGTPVLNLAQGPLAGCEISKIQGILNGTTNYILTEMESGRSFDEVLKMAQEKGYAEADPAGDVEGYDARAKVTILANALMDAHLNIDDVSCKGITNISSADIEQAKIEGARWKLIGLIEKTPDGVIASVNPEKVVLSHPLADVSGVLNALSFTTDLLGEVSIIGPGAGGTETGFAILSDLLRIHLEK